MSETNDLVSKDFEDIDFTIDVNVTDAGTELVCNSNNIKDKIQSLVDRYGSIEITPENVNLVKAVKANFVSLRTRIERERTDFRKMHIDPLNVALNGMCGDLQAIVAKGEDAVTEQLRKYDQKRLDMLNMAIDGYTEEAIQSNGLRPEFASRMVRQKWYYNKTASEADIASDIEAQAMTIRKQQDEHDTGILLINRECEESGLLADSYIRMLEYKTVTEVLLMIKEDACKRAQPVEKPVEKPSKKAKGEKSSEIVRVVRLRYTDELRNDVQKAFAGLVKAGVELTPIDVDLTCI